MKHMMRDPAQSSRFRVEIDNQPVGAFTECQLPHLEIKLQEIQEGGLNGYKHELPGITSVGHVTLKHGLVMGDILLAWYYLTMLSSVNGSLSTGITKSVSIIMIGNNLYPMYSFNLAVAYPVKWEGPSFRSGENAVAVESIELAHQGMTIMPFPPPPPTAGPT